MDCELLAQLVNGFLLTFGHKKGIAAKQLNGMCRCALVPTVGGLPGANDRSGYENNDDYQRTGSQHA